VFFKPLIFNLSGILLPNTPPNGGKRVTKAGKREEQEWKKEEKVWNRFSCNRLSRPEIGLQFS